MAAWRPDNRASGKGPEGGSQGVAVDRNGAVESIGACKPVRDSCRGRSGCLCSTNEPGLGIACLVKSCIDYYNGVPGESDSQPCDTKGS